MTLSQNKNIIEHKYVTLILLEGGGGVVVYFRCPVPNEEHQRVDQVYAQYMRGHYIGLNGAILWPEVTCPGQEGFHIDALRNCQHTSTVIKAWQQHPRRPSAAENKAFTVNKVKVSWIML